ncbi:MAG TPA: IniB N-terminal domain-containing protein [Pseudonocardiaceae bacterium]|nr:IniB N-terminal domain-containing protein [Pseudonocardiaceae bacterium]
MEQADQTLHDFVLNLLSDAQAAAAFEQDPAAVLDHAGLSDISAADVQEVIPLVIDYVPTHAQALDAVLGQLPLDSVDTGQLGAIQQLQFVTQALGGIPPVTETGAIGGLASGALELGNDGQGAMSGLGVLNTPLGGITTGMSGDLEHGLTTATWDHGVTGSGSGNFTLPGLDSLPGLGGGLPSGFSSVSDVTDTLDGHTSPLGNSTSAAANLLSGAADLTAGALANPAAVAGVLNDPAGAITGLTGTADSFAMMGSQALPAPANEVVGQVVQTAGSATSGVVGNAMSTVQNGPLGNLTSHLPVADATHGLSSVQGVVDQVTGGLTGQLGTGALSSVTGGLDAGSATHAVQSTVSSVQSTVTDTVHSTVSDTVGSVASHSAVSDVTSTTGAGSLLGSADHTDVVGDLGHVTNDLHLPSLF